MRSVVFERFGKPEEVLEVKQRPVPDPGPGQVRVKLLLSPIHNHDLMIISGTYGMLPQLPAVPGTEAVGIVDALGEGVTNLKAGQRVCGGASAVWAEYFLADAARLIAVPDAIPDETACQLIAMPLSAWRLFEELEVKPGDWIIQNVANGAVGKLIARRAMERGVNVVNLVRREAAVAELAALGIPNAVSTAKPGWQNRVAALTGGAPIIRGLDSIGGSAPEQMLSLMGEKSVLYLFGALSGEKLAIDPGIILYRQAMVKGFWAAKPSDTVSPERMGELIGELVQRAASGELRLPVAEVFDLADAAKAAAASNVPGRPGKIVLRG
ncbi:MAG TPA: zinc-binding dehydrogenase [Devosiaceae bacterium]|nr:zinc-binding dehydrogenase [Devosiaceae bacterium]